MWISKNLMFLSLYPRGKNQHPLDGKLGETQLLVHGGKGKHINSTATHFAVLAYMKFK
jgi:hypothetical protein